MKNIFVFLLLLSINISANDKDKLEEKVFPANKIPQYQYSLYLLNIQLIENNDIENLKQNLLQTNNIEYFLKYLKNNKIITLNKFKIKTPFKSFNYESTSDIFKNNIDIDIEIEDDENLTFNFKYSQEIPRTFVRTLNYKEKIRELDKIIHSNNILKNEKERFEYEELLKDGLTEIENNFKEINSMDIINYNYKKVVQTYSQNKIEIFNGRKQYELGKIVFLDDIFYCDENQNCETLMLLLKINKN